MAFHGTYAARNVLTNYAGIDLSSGIPEDTFISMTENTGRASFRKGLDGNTSASISPDNSYTVTLSFFPESATAQALTNLYSTLRVADEAGEQTLAAFPLGIYDPSGSGILGSLEAVIQKAGDQSYGADTGTVDFEFYVESGFKFAAKGDTLDSIKETLKEIGIDTDKLQLDF